MIDAKEKAEEGWSLTDDQKKTIEEANGWSMTALAELGAAYLEFNDAEAAYLKAKTNMAQARAAALNAEMTRGNVVAALANSLSLPQGEWTYDSQQGKLIKRST